MNTPSHLILTAALCKRFRTIPMRTSAVLVGSVAPDLPLFALSIGAFFYYRYARGWTSRQAFEWMFGTLYFHDPLWIASHSVLHAPLLLLPLLLVLGRAGYSGKGAANWWFWFAASALFHTFIDYGTHYDDGPLLLFPLNWSFRISSPISYWDPAHYGRPFVLFEIALDIALIIYLLPRRQRRGTAIADEF